MTRNTPTGVGKTVLIAMINYPFKKHPHGRGEDASLSIAPPATPETPPRAWGRPR